uniref:Uncharacterized protein n=1 Tax=Oryza rufipogon TaxID=4529 RepID=A0A0E0QMK9_ORYRU
MRNSHTNAPNGLTEIFLDFSSASLASFCRLPDCCRNLRSIYKRRRRFRQPSRQCRFPLPYIQLLCHSHLPMGPKASSSALGAVICSCIQPEQRRGTQPTSGIRNSTRVAMIVPAVRPLAKYTLELCVSTPPPVAAAAMKECVLDEYATKHRISIDRFLQLRIFVKKAEYECNRLPAMIDAHLFRDYHLAFWFGLFCAWGQPQDGDLHLWLPHQCRCHLGPC